LIGDAIAGSIEYAGAEEDEGRKTWKRFR
jgi:hypothetical protein